MLLGYDKCLLFCPLKCNPSGRGGLGQEKELKRKQEEMAKMREVMAHKRAKMAVHRKGNFLQQMSERFSEKEVQKDLYNSQKACAHLDHEQVEYTILCLID